LALELSPEILSLVLVEFFEPVLLDPEAAGSEVEAAGAGVLAPAGVDSLEAAGVVVAAAELFLFEEASLDGYFSAGVVELASGEVFSTGVVVVAAGVVDSAGAVVVGVAAESPSP
jgi:hypothetical protein